MVIISQFGANCRIITMLLGNEGDMKLQKGGNECAESQAGWLR